MIGRRWERADVVRACIAGSWLGEETAAARLGEIELREHQRGAVARLRDAITRYGGALLADEVGLGKTYTALAAASDARSLLIVSPASLASMWRRALGLARLRADVISLEALSRGRSPTSSSYDLVIVDEAHHARNPTTRRYAELAALTRASRVLLLSATPIHNAETDLHALLALFLGSRAARMAPPELAACVVRRTRSDVALARTPTRAAPRWLTVPASAAVLDALLAVPPPCPARDGADAGVLVTLSLIRIWASTEAALRVALASRLARAQSIEDALARGRHPTRAEMRAWVVGDDATQLAFPELVAATVVDDGATALMAAVRRHANGVRHALAVLASAEGASDDRRANLIREIRRRHGGDRVVVFSQFAESVKAMFARLRRDPGVACVTAGGALVAGGALTRDEALARFAPLASGAVAPGHAEAIELLIATDLLSEGLNLQDASVVVHLDLPWTAARLTQRVGRVWRIGSVHDAVHEYAIAPPVPAERVLQSIELLRRKSGVARTAIGDVFAPLLATGLTPGSATGMADAPSAMEALRRTLTEWRRADSANDAHAESAPRRSMPPRGRRGRVHAPTLVGAVRSTLDGWLAVAATDAGLELIVARSDCGPTTDPARAIELATVAGGATCAAAPARVARALAELERFLAERRAAAEVALATVGSRPHGRVAGRIAAVVAAAPAHRRVAVSRLAAEARDVVEHTRAAGGERLLAALAARAGHSDATGVGAEAWLTAVIETGAGSPRLESSPALGGELAVPPAGESAVRALLLLVRPG